ncbi:MAG: hypothetical protein GY795_44420 [Desulfobacterales bacterium]|nr:hypothetical protein [Desulfobacterales bacterium]
MKFWQSLLYSVPKFHFGTPEVQTAFGRMHTFLSLFFDYDRLDKSIQIL